MTKYFARVELHNADSTAYDSLHEKMQKISFYRFIIDVNVKGKQIGLPPGCYLGFSDTAIDTVFQSIRKIADSVTALNKVYCAAISDDRFIADF